MNTNLQLQISKYSLLEDDPFKSVLKVWIVSVGGNPNQTYFSKNAIEKASTTLYNQPVFCLWNGYDFLEHARNEQQEKDKRCIGVIPESSELQFEEYEGKEYLTGKLVVWKAYYPEFAQHLNNDFTKISMEVLEITSHQRQEDGFKEVDEFAFLSIFLLGKNFATGIENAHTKMLKYSSQEYNQLVKDTNKQLATFSIPNNVKDNAQKALELPQKNPQLIQFAKEIINNESFTYSKITQLFSKINNLRKEENILFYGGHDGRDFYKNVILKFENEVTQENNKKEENDLMNLNKYGLTQLQTREIINNVLNQTTYTQNEYTYHKYWLFDNDEEYIYVEDNEIGENKRIPYQITDNMATIEFDKSEVVIKAGYQPVGSVSETYSKEEYEKVSTEKDEMCGKYADVEAKYSELMTKFTEMEAKFADIESKYSEVEAKYGEVESKYATLKEQYAEKEELCNKYARKEEEIKMFSKVEEYSQLLSKDEVKEISDKIKESTSTYSQIKELVEEKVAIKAKLAFNNPNIQQDSNSIKINFASLPVGDEKNTKPLSYTERLKRTFGE